MAPRFVRPTNAFWGTEKGPRKVSSPGPQCSPRTQGGVWGYLLAALTVGVVDVVEAVLIDLAQPHVLPDTHQAIGVPPAVPPGEPDPNYHPHVPWGLGGVTEGRYGEAHNVEWDETWNTTPTKTSGHV